MSVVMSGVAGVTVAFLAASSPYERVRDTAKAVANLGRFLEKYVGDCESDDPQFDKTACEKAAKDVRGDYRGRVLRVEVDEVSELMRVGKFDPERGFQVLLTPFFSERGLGMSVGKPKRLTSEGFPVVKNVPIWVKLPDGEPEFAFRRRLDRGMVRLELLVKPKRAWRMSKRGGEAVRGAEVALVGVRVYASRGDRVLAEQTY